jgi:hypothetical protein
MNSGFVYGAGNSLYRGQQDPHFFDCAHEALHNLNSAIAKTAVSFSGTRGYSLVKDHLFVLDHQIELGETFGTYELIECDLDTNFVHSMRKLRTHSGTLSFLFDEE